MWQPRGCSLQLESTAAGTMLGLHARHASHELLLTGGVLRLRVLWRPAAPGSLAELSLNCSVGQEPAAAPLFPLVRQASWCDGASDLLPVSSLRHFPSKIHVYSTLLESFLASAALKTRPTE